MTSIIVPLHEHSNGRIKKFWNITKLAKRRSLSISNHDEIGTNVIALDVGKRKLLYANTTPGRSSCLIVDLNNLERCTVKKEYNSINAGDLIKMKLHQFLKRIFIHLVFKNRSGTISLPMFEAKQEQNNNMEQFERIAKKWESIVTKLLTIQKREIA